MKKMKKFAALLLAVSMAAGMVACGSSDKKEETTKKEETKKDDKETKKLEGTLKVVTTGDAYQPLFDKFTEEVGPKVEFISMSSGEVLSKLKAEGGTPAADLWFGGGIDAFMDAKDNDLLEKVDFDAADELAPEFKDSDNYWFSKGVTVVGFIVNNDILKEKGLDGIEAIYSLHSDNLFPNQDKVLSSEHISFSSDEIPPDSHPCDPIPLPTP